MKGLAPKQAEVLEFLIYCHADGQPPTLREIADYMGVASVNTPGAHLNALEKGGYIKRVKGGKRAIRLTAKALGDAAMMAVPRDLWARATKALSGTELGDEMEAV